MKKILLILFSVLLIVAGSGCATASSKRYDAAVKGIYQVNSSLKAGRVDLAQKYSDQLVRLVPPPKKLDVIKPVETKNSSGQTTKYVVLPQEYSGTPTLSIGTKPFEDIVAADPALQKQLVEENKAVDKFHDTVDNTLRAVDKEAMKKEEGKGFFGWLWTIFGSLGIVGVIALIVVCAVFPAAIPVVVGVFHTVVGFVNGLLAGIASLFKKKGS